MTVKIYTKTGDDGTTGLIGGSRIKKYDLRIEAYGTVDELNSWIGCLRPGVESEKVKETLFEIQNKLFNIGSRLASDDKGESFTRQLSLEEKDIFSIEKAIDYMESGLPPLDFFILPGGDTLVAQCHIARTVCRRAERRITELAEVNTIDPDIVKYINRLSDFLFVLARFVAKEKNIPEDRWKS